MLERGLPAIKKRKFIIGFISKDNPKRFCLIKGETGSGKSTQIPQYLY